MYLITVEGGDGSGKGIATQMLAEICSEEFTFTDVSVTGEPRRNHPLGKLAVEAVRTGEAGPVHEASMFAADRLDHSHAWIVPRLARGEVVISERNVHSSLVYQGIVGDLGLGEVARLNSAACVPDLCVWVDCDPAVALQRISKGALSGEISTRDADKQEYFETDELQTLIRAGYASLLGGEVRMPAPFDKGEIAGPVVNDGGKIDLKKKLQRVIRDFLYRRARPLNVSLDEVECHLLGSALRWQRGQRTLDVVDTPPPRSNSNWLNGEKPWRVMQQADLLYRKAWNSVPVDTRADVPQDPLAHTVVSIVGTLSLLPGAEVSELRRWLGPVRAVTSRHTQRMVKFLHEQSGWVRVHRPLKGADAPRSELRPDWQAYGRLGLALWPLKEALSELMQNNPESSWKSALNKVLGRNPDAAMRARADACLSRIEELGSGATDYDAPTDIDGLRMWWRDGPA